MEEKETVYLTPEGAQKFRAELTDLVENQRPALAARLRAAIQQGDLSENADYAAAKEEQSFLEGRIQQLEAMLRSAVMISSDTRRDVVGVGAHVTIVEEGEPPETYHVVGAAEASPKDGRISNVSPLGKALLGRRVGDQIAVPAPSGTFTVRITKIE